MASIWHEGFETTSTGYEETWSEGETTDGHRYVGEALSRGAVGCVIREGRIPSGLDQDRLLETPDPLAALAALARFVRHRLSCRVIGITGSLGKTTTKELLATILGGGFETAKAPRSFNNNIGVPLTLFQASAGKLPGLNPGY